LQLGRCFYQTAPICNLHQIVNIYPIIVDVFVGLHQYKYGIQMIRLSVYVNTDNTALWKTAQQLIVQQMTGLG
jgi:hypothetical protein